MSTAAKVLGGLTAVAALAFGGCHIVSPRTTEREGVIKIKRGVVAEFNVKPGVKYDAYLPHVDYIRLPLFLQTVEVEAKEADALSIRTKERARVYGTFKIKFTIDNKDPNFGKVYTDLKADKVEDLFPHIADYTMPAAIEAYRDISMTDISDSLTVIGEKMRTALQHQLNSKGYTYIKISDVVPSGVGLSAQANRDLEQIVSEQRKLDLQKTQAQVAEAAVELTKKQAKVTTEAISELRKAGVPENQLASFYYMQLMRDGDHIGKPSVPGPIPGTGIGVVPGPR